MDLDAGGHIAPWYVDGNASDECEAHYWPGNWPGVGTATPLGTVLHLTIDYKTAAHQVVFTIVDVNLSKTWTKSIPYSGPAFIDASTQFEAQPSFNATIAKYKFSGWMTGLEITPQGGAPQNLTAQYMAPITTNAPPTWDETFYNANLSGYEIDLLVDRRPGFLRSGRGQEGIEAGGPGPRRAVHDPSEEKTPCGLQVSQLSYRQFVLSEPPRFDVDLRRVDGLSIEVQRYHRPRNGRCGLVERLRVRFRSGQRYT